MTNTTCSPLFGHAKLIRRDKHSALYRINPPFSGTDLIAIKPMSGWVIARPVEPGSEDKWPDHDTYAAFQSTGPNEEVALLGIPLGNGPYFRRGYYVQDDSDGPDVSALARSKFLMWRENLSERNETRSALDAADTAIDAMCALLDGDTEAFVEILETGGDL